MQLRICVIVYLYVPQCNRMSLAFSFQKMFSLCGLKGHIVEVRGGVKLVDNGRRRTTECEGRARILGGRIRNLSWVSTTFLAWHQSGQEW